MSHFDTQSAVWSLIQYLLYWFNWKVNPVFRIQLRIQHTPLCRCFFISEFFTEISRILRPYALHYCGARIEIIIQICIIRTVSYSIFNAVSYFVVLYSFIFFLLLNFLRTFFTIMRSTIKIIILWSYKAGYTLKFINVLYFLCRLI